MSKEEGKEVEKVPDGLPRKEKEILEKLMKDIAASTDATAVNFNECQPKRSANKVCSGLKANLGKAGPSEESPPRISSAKSPENVMSQRSRLHPPQMPQMQHMGHMQQIQQMQQIQPKQQMLPMPRKWPRAEGCTCKPGTRNSKTIDQTNTSNSKKRLSYVDGQTAKMGNWMQIQDFNLFGQAIASELKNRSPEQANMLKHNITRAILGIDEGRISFSSSSVPYSKHAHRLSTQYSDNEKTIQPSREVNTVREDGKSSGLLQTDSYPTIQKRIGSIPFYNSKTQLFEYDRKQESNSKEIVLEEESSLSLDLEDTGDHLIEWPSNTINATDTDAAPNLLAEIKKDFEEKYNKNKKD